MSRPMDGPSPSPSLMPPPGSGASKRPRPSNTSTTGAAGPSRVKRRKPENQDDGDGGRASGAGKGKDEDGSGEIGEITTKIDFKSLPPEALYLYLECHDLLPRWDVSPWSEEPCTPPNALYNAAPFSAIQAIQAPLEKMTTPPPEPKPALPEATMSNIASVHTTELNGPTTIIETLNAPNAPTEQNGQHETDTDQVMAEGDGTDEQTLDEGPAPPTTRSKTAPSRKPPTPTLSPSPPRDVKRGVITLSDVEAARYVMAEKANAHWVKGLGGGQNKEGETIVNFLYKMKAGPTRLLRVYNPWPAPYP